VDTWTFIWLMFFLKIPIVALFLLVRWAVGQTPEGATGQEGGIGPSPSPRPVHPHHPRSGLPRTVRRGPRHEPAPGAPPRIRAVVAHKRFAQR
jgi:hypothetical protein